ncbi:USP domain-containing protein [Abeliophyllum distichum]|uniref:USP domain-containing protein n=1 Tax=Abeliophyllum distichum TaxID=126358 RepID=A0ABD1Q3K6_9LAMI
MNLDWKKEFFSARISDSDLKLQSFIPNRVDNDWAEMFLNYSWKLLDLNATIKMLEEKSKSKATNFQKLHFTSAMRTIVVLDSDALLSWIYIREQLASWIFASKEKAQQGKKILLLHKHPGYLLVNDLCCKERIKRDHDVPQSYDSVLRKWQEVLIIKRQHDV